MDTGKVINSLTIFDNDKIWDLVILREPPGWHRGKIFYGRISRIDYQGGKSLIDRRFGTFVCVTDANGGAVHDQPGEDEPCSGADEGEGHMGAVTRELRELQAQLLA